MRRLCTIVIAAATMLANSAAFAQSTIGDYRSNVFISGNWNDASSWERFNGTTWVAAVAPPSNANGVITIVNGDRIDLSVATTIDQVVIEPTGQLSIFNVVTPFVCTLVNGPGTDLVNNGTLLVSVNATLSGAGTISNNAGATFTLNLGSTLGAGTTNNGIMVIDNAATFSSNTVINTAAITLQGSALNLNNATLINHGTITLPSILDTSISGTGGGVFINDTDGIIFKTASLGTTRIDPVPGTVSFTNLGVLKGSGDFAMRTTVVNTGTIAPGDNGAGSLMVSPAFVTGKAPVFSLDITASGALAGITYDLANFSNVDAATINISGSTLTMTDAGSDAIGTTYTIFVSSSTIVGTFATVNLPATLGNLTYNANTITVQKIASVKRYTWIGGSSLWSTAGNWSPSRTAPATTDVLTFSSGTSVTLTGVPTETIGMLNISNNTTVSLQAATASKTLTIGNGPGFILNIDPGSTLRSLNNAGVVLNLTINAGSRAVVGGVAQMQNGTFNIGDNTLLLHTTAIPLIRTAGQFTLGSNGSIEFGDALHTAGPAITLNSSIFVAPPSINRISVFRTNGAVFGNQDITVNQAEMTLGNLTTNSSARLRFSTTATNPVETSVSKIIGYADMIPRAVGTTALDFLGMSLSAGANVGTVSLTRITGSAGINTFNGFSSIAATWNVTATVEPSPARNISFSWLSDFDNNANTSLQFQDYRFDTGPSWTAVGSLAFLASTGNPRTTTAAAALKLTGSWTIADQLNVLPIVLSSLKGEQVDNSIVLTWKTLSEINGDYFEVHRNREGEEGFTVIGTVRAHGTTNKPQTYSYIDAEAEEGINYYRLKLVDFDGSFDHSKIIGVSFELTGDFTIYPNPNTGKTVTFMFSQTSGGTINIFDMTNRKIVSQPIGQSAESITIDDLDLTSGMYLIMYESAGKIICRRLMVH